MPKKGYKQKEEHKEKTKKIHTGMKQSEATIKKRLATFERVGYKPKPPSPLGNKNCLGRKRPQVEKDKISKNNARYWLGRKGDKSSGWQGGKSFEPYTTDWTITLKRAIRERDNYICQKCSQYGNSIHHIDYDKKNCNSNNLITLCRRCNTEVNFNRKYWTNYFQILCNRG